MEHSNAKGKIEIKKPTITRETQIEIMRFFLKTSIPRKLKSEEQKS